ncbi:MAG: lipoprotein ABC transporter ATP-binding protein [Gammaproteobacteria bacterium RIFCSPHIGHO2_12_FULL_41_20]|nr:MAG: lipoprotein ABC transporter ATP-binding protein [Gammaproteobacteria bacterium RIFCSPHIGHO2_12_FULL_41_20]
MSNSSSAPVLFCEALTKTYVDGATKIAVLRHIDLQVQAAEMLAIVGASGSGKSTLLHLLGGLDKPTAGKVVIQGKDMASFSEEEKCHFRNQHLGFIYQFHYLLPEFTALENVGMPLLIRGASPAVITEKAAHLLELAGLKERLQHRLGQLSGGERQRVAIARALVTDPVCVLADEPTGNLDPGNAERVWQLFMDLQRSRQTSVVIVTHDRKLAQQAHRILSLEYGRLVTAE